MRASSSRKAATRRRRLWGSRAGVMSASYVALGKPCRRAANAPIRTKSTPWRASVVRRRSGLRGVTGETGSDTAHVVQELAQILHLFQPLLRRHAKNPRNVVQHVRPHNDVRFKLRSHLDARRAQQARERLPGRAGLASLDARDDGLRGAGPAREDALAEASA